MHEHFGQEPKKTMETMPTSTNCNSSANESDTTTSLEKATQNQKKTSQDIIFEELIKTY